MGELATSEPEITWNKASPLRTFDGKICRIKWHRRKPNSIKPWRSTPKPIRTSSERKPSIRRRASPSQLTISLRKLNATRAAMDNAKATLLQSQLTLGDADLKAPFSGYILSRNIDLGSLVSPSTNAFTIADIGRVKVAFGAPDYVLSRVRLGQELTIQTENNAAPVKGRVTSISPAADTRNRIFAVEVTVSNRDRHLKPGMIASVGLGEVPHSSISIPLSAIVPLPSEPDHFAVMVAQDRAGRLVANLRKVQMGTTHENSVAVEGVQPGERVVSVGAQLLKDGD